MATDKSKATDKKKVEVQAEEPQVENLLKDLPVVDEMPDIPMKQVTFAMQYQGCTGGIWYSFEAGETGMIAEEVYHQIKNIPGLLERD